MIQPGRFITLEGGEGVGKSTQAKRLAEVLRARGKTVIVTREPGGTPGAEAIRDLLMTGSTDRWSARVEALLFAAARADHVERVIRPALERGDWVICDRFIDSTRAYQGGAGGESDAEIMALHGFGSGGLLPDRTIVLTMSFDEAEQRALIRDKGQGDRFSDQTWRYHMRLFDFFQKLSEVEPDRVRAVNAKGQPEEVTDRLLTALDGLL